MTFFGGGAVCLSMMRNSLNNWANAILALASTFIPQLLIYLKNTIYMKNCVFYLAYYSF